jgi:hypothetical protein
MITWISDLVCGTNQMTSLTCTGDESFFCSVFYRPRLD